MIQNKEAENLRKQAIKSKRAALRSSLKTIIPSIIETEKKIINSNDFKKKLAISRKKSMSQNIKNFQLLSPINDVAAEMPLSDYFQIINKIGEGSHSIVYKCCNKFTKKIHAVKFLKRMRMSYQIMKLINHRFIAQANFLFLQEKAGTCQVVTEFYDFPDLRKVLTNAIKAQAIIDESFVANVVYKILIATSYMHEKGICHRDIKPENILYNSITGQMKIIDFELCKMHRYSHQKIELWSNTGSLQYRAPESFYGGYSYEIDIWAIGVIAYEMLVGRLPFECQFEYQYIKKVCNTQINYDSLEISSLSKKFLSKLLCKQPTKRMSAKQALADPFLLQYVQFQASTCTSPLNSSFDCCKTPESEDQTHYYSKFYDQNVQFSFLGCLSSDIGIRVLQQ